MVVVLPTVFQSPLFLRWILTGTLAAQAVNPSPTLTSPLADQLFFSLSVTLLECVLLTVKLVALVAVPPGVVTLIGPVVAVVGTVAVIWVAESTTNVAVTLLNVTAVVVKLAPLTVPLKFVPVILTDVPTGPKVGRERGDRRSRHRRHGEVGRAGRLPSGRVHVDRTGRRPRRNDGRGAGRAWVRRGDEAEVLKRTAVARRIERSADRDRGAHDAGRGREGRDAGHVAAAPVVYGNDAEVLGAVGRDDGRDQGQRRGSESSTSSWVLESMCSPVPALPPNST